MLMENINNVGTSHSGEVFLTEDFNVRTGCQQFCIHGFEDLEILHDIKDGDSMRTSAEIAHSIAYGHQQSSTLCI